MNCQYLREQKKINQARNHLVKHTLKSPSGYRERDKVVFNMENITKGALWDKMNPLRKEFILANQDKVMTVEYDKRHIKSPCVFCLKEDNSKTKWLWHGSEITKANKEEE